MLTQTISHTTLIGEIGTLVLGLMSLTRSAPIDVFATVAIASESARRSQ